MGNQRLTGAAHVSDKDEMGPDANEQAKAVIQQAILQGASDIHVDHFRHQTRIRYRIGGALQETESVPKSAGIALCDAMKHMAQMVSDEKHALQAEAINFAAWNGRKYQLRIITIPTSHGEGLVVRLVDERCTKVCLRDIFGEEDAELLSASANRSNGVLFITGPVGAGKSTVLYAVLNDIIANGPQRKVHALVENPVDFRLEGIVQTEVSPSAGLTRPVILRHLLLCDPDVIVVPEFPDRETTESLLTAALARRFAITRLHADDALDALQRMMALSERHAILVDADVTICCVKIVRALCGHCRERIASRPEELERMGLPPFDAGVDIWRPAGCEACGNTGYSGKMGILELLHVDASVAGAAYRAEGPARVREAALDAGMRTFRQSAMSLVRKGITSAEEAASACGVSSVTQTDSKSINTDQQ